MSNMFDLLATNPSIQARSLSHLCHQMCGTLPCSSRQQLERLKLQHLHLCMPRGMMSSTCLQNTLYRITLQLKAISLRHAAGTGGLNTIGMQDQPDAKQLVSAGHAVEFSNVTYEYTAGTPVLHNVSFNIAGGKTLALVGATGSGEHHPPHDAPCYSLRQDEAFIVWLNRQLST